MSKPYLDHPQWVRYEANSSLLQPMVLTLAGELAHRRLRDSVWATGRWPVASSRSTSTLARADLKAWPRILSELRSIGWHNHGQRLVNHDMGRVLAEAKAFQAARSASCGVAAKARWQASRASVSPPAAHPCQAALALPATPDASRNASRNAPRNASPHPSRNASPMPVQYSNRTVPLAVNAERLMRSVSPRKGSASTEEKDFIEEVTATMEGFSPKFAGGELENWGGWWRNRFRENPDKAGRVLAEIRSMVREHRIQTNPGAAATDLWNRLP